jgi:hypothetical protein
MSLERRLRRRNRIAHRPIVKARLAVLMAHGLTLRDAAAQLEVPERTARDWSAEFHWRAWIDMARDQIARDPMARDDRIAQFLLDELGRGRLEDRRRSITRADVDHVADMVQTLAADVAERRGAPVEEVLAWAKRPAPHPLDAEQAKTVLEREHLALTTQFLTLLGASETRDGLDAEIVRAWTPQQVEAFWRHVDRTGDGCRLWRGPRCGPAGVANVGGHGLRVARVAGVLAFGVPRAACPSNPYCARPDHLAEKETLQ